MRLFSPSIKSRHSETSPQKRFQYLPRPCVWLYSTDACKGGSSAHHQARLTAHDERSVRQRRPQQPDNTRKRTTDIICLDAI